MFAAKHLAPNGGRARKKTCFLLLLLLLEHNIKYRDYKENTTFHPVLPPICRMHLLILGQSKFSAWVPNHPSLFFMQIALPPTCLFSFPPSPSYSPLFPRSQPPEQPHRQKRDGFWSTGRKEVLGVMGRGGGCHSTVRRNARGAMQMRCWGIFLHRTVGRMEKVCLIPSLYLRITAVRGKGDLGGYNGNRQHVMGREGKPGEGEGEHPPLPPGASKLRAN